MRQEGLNYIFIHRSFQEYFTSYSMIYLFPKYFDEFIPEIEKRGNDIILPMCFDMNESMVVDNYISPTYSSFSRDGCFSEDNGDKYIYLASLNLEAELILRKGNSDEAEVSLRMSGNDQVRNTLESLMGIMGASKSGGVERGFYNIIDVFPFFSAADRSGLALLSDVLYGIDIIFKREEIDIQWNIRTEVPSEDLHLLMDGGFIDLCEREFLEIEKTLRKKIVGLKKWCREIVLKNQRSKKSIDEILGL